MLTFTFYVIEEKSETQDRYDKLPKVTQPVSSRALIKIQFYFIPSLDVLATATGREWALIQGPGTPGCRCGRQHWGIQPTKVLIQWVSRKLGQSGILVLLGADRGCWRTDPVPAWSHHLETAPHQSSAVITSRHAAMGWELEIAQYLFTLQLHATLNVLQERGGHPAINWSLLPG